MVRTWVASRRQATGVFRSTLPPVSIVKTLPRSACLYRQNFKILAVTAVIGFASMWSGAQAQSGPAPGATKFFGSFTVNYADTRNFPKGRRIATIGLHPESAEIAKANACVLSQPYPKDYEQCLNPANSISCNNGGYFAVAEHYVQTGTVPFFNAQQPLLENAIGLSCGKASLVLAQSAAIESCEKARQKRGLPDAPPNGQAGDYNCAVIASGRNDGKYGGEVQDFSAWWANKAPNAFLALKMECWGTESATKWGPARGCR